MFVTLFLGVLDTRSGRLTYTDGVTDAIDSGEQMYGEERLQKLLAGMSEKGGRRGLGPLRQGPVPRRLRARIRRTLRGGSGGAPG